MGLDLKGLTRLLQGVEGSTAKLEIERDGQVSTVEGTRIKCA